MLNELLYAITSRLPCRIIPREDGGPYLERYYVGELLGTKFYLHRFVSSDREPRLHNHPWTWGRALVLSGGYDEEVVTDLCPHALSATNERLGCVTRIRRVNWWNVVDGSHFHRVACADKGTWTLFMHGKRAVCGYAEVRKGWGFIEKEGHQTVFTPYPAGDLKWWETAPVGAAIGRSPLEL